MSNAGQVFCGDCGASISARAKFCVSCGAAQTVESGELAAVATPPRPGARDAPVGPPPPRQVPGTGVSGHKAAPGLGLRALDPQARELANELASQLTTPGILMATLTALITAGVVLAFGVLAAVISPDNSIIGRVGASSSIVEEALRLAVGSTMARLDLGESSHTVVPLSFVLVPLLGAAGGGYMQSVRTAGLPAVARLAWAAAAGLPLAVIALVLGLVSGGDIGGTPVDFALGGVFFYALLWGAAGAVIGTAVRMRREGTDITALAPTAVRAWLPLVAMPARSLAIALAASALVGFVVWEAQTIRGEETAKLFRPTATAVIENVTLGGEFGVSALGMGLFAQGTQAAFPVDDDLDSDDSAKFRGSEGEATDDASYRIFSYRHVYAPYIFIPLLLVIVAIPMLLMLYGGFSTVRSMGVVAPGWAAAYGASVGLVWSIGLVLVRAIAKSDTITGDSLFGWALMLGAIVGAAGGVLSALASQSGSAEGRSHG